MTNLPDKNELSGDTVTQGGFKTSLNGLIDYLKETLGGVSGAINPSTAGSIDNMAIGANHPKPATFTDINATGTCNLNGIAKSDLSNVPADNAVFNSLAKTDLSNIDSGLIGTAASKNVGTAANNVVQLDASGKLPAVDGSQLTDFPTVFTKEYTSTDLDWVGNTTVSFAHNLGVEPKYAHLFLVCKDPIYGYQIGDVIKVDSHGDASYGIMFNTTQLRVAMDDAAFTAWRNDTTARFRAAKEYFKIRVRAWA